MEDDGGGNNDNVVIDMDVLMDYDENLDMALPSPLQRTGHIALKYKNRMLVWGGYQCGNLHPEIKYLPTTTVCFYDYVLDKWHFQSTGEENAPPGTSAACGLIYYDMLFVFGGFCEGNNNEIYSLNLSSFEWQKYDCNGARPLACDKMVGWVHEERLYFFGGYGVLSNHPDFLKSKFCQFSIEENFGEFPQKGWNNQLVIFDPRAKKWIWPSFRGPPPLPRAAHAAAKIGNKLYVFGGRHKSIRMNDLHCLDLETMTWSDRLTMKGTLPQGRSWHSFTPISDALVVLFGGFSQQEKALSDCWVLNLPTLTWTKAELPCNKARLWHTACVGDQGEVIIFGGCGGNGLDPRALNMDEYILTIWFSPKSLLRLSMDTVAMHKQILAPIWHTLPLALQEVLRLKSSTAMTECLED